MRGCGGRHRLPDEIGGTFGAVGRDDHPSPRDRVISQFGQLRGFLQSDEKRLTTLDYNVAEVHYSDEYSASSSVLDCIRERFQNQLHVFSSGAVTHRADAQHLSCQRAEAARNLHAVLLQQKRA